MSQITHYLKLTKAGWESSANGDDWSPYREGTDIPISVDAKISTFAINVWNDTSSNIQINFRSSDGKHDATKPIEKGTTAKQSWDIRELPVYPLFWEWHVDGFFQESTTARTQGVASFEARRRNEIPDPIFKVSKTGG